MAPVARGVPDAEENWDVALARLGESLLGPLPPVHGVVGVLLEVRRRGVLEAVHQSTLTGTALHTDRGEDVRRTGRPPRADSQSSSPPPEHAPTRVLRPLPELDEDPRLALSPMSPTSAPTGRAVVPGTPAAPRPRVHRGSAFGGTSRVDWVTSSRRAEKRTTPASAVFGPPSQVVAGAARETAECGTRGLRSPQ